MQFKPIHINSDGIEHLLYLADHPELFDNHHIELEEPYMTGLSVPGVAVLDTVFCVPIIGDNEPISLTIDWANKQYVEYDKRIVFDGMITADNPERTPKTNDELDMVRFQTDEEEDADEQLQEAFSDFVGDWGGFLHIAVEVLCHSDEPTIMSAEAELLLMETEQEFKQMHDILGTGKLSAAQLVTVIKLAHSSPLDSGLAILPYLS